VYIGIQEINTVLNTSLDLPIPNGLVIGTGDLVEGFGKDGFANFSKDHHTHEDGVQIEFIKTRYVGKECTYVLQGHKEYINGIYSVEKQYEILGNSYQFTSMGENISIIELNGQVFIVGHTDLWVFYALEGFYNGKGYAYEYNCKYQTILMHAALLGVKQAPLLLMTMKGIDCGRLERRDTKEYGTIFYPTSSNSMIIRDSYSSFNTGFDFHANLLAFPKLVREDDTHYFVDVTPYSTGLVNSEGERGSWNDPLSDDGLIMVKK